MSFPIVCPNCGAPSGPSTGVCPFCKSVVAAAASAGPRGVEAVRKAIADGDLPRALALSSTVAAEDAKALENVEFLLLYAKILLESEGPSSKIRSLLGKALVIEPANGAVAEYLEIVEAKALLTREKNDLGERRLAEIIRRSPNNAHALFLLGAHLFWVSGETASAVRYLERCVALNAKFLRAWGCLGSIYEKLGNAALAGRAFRQCAILETNPEMRSFFERKAAAAVA